MNSHARSALALLTLVSHVAAADTPAVPGGAARPSATVIARACLGCHRVSHDGDAIPSLRQLSQSEFLARMRAFRDGRKPATVMNRIASGYRDEDFRALAAWYGKP